MIMLSLCGCLPVFKYDVLQAISLGHESRYFLILVSKAGTKKAVQVPRMEEEQENKECREGSVLLKDLAQQRSGEL
ncbi:MAG: hypothetical protein ACPGVG_18935 [Mycobacterium sp.]